MIADMNSHKKRRIFSNSCPTSSTTTHKEFPEEVLINEILVRLPVKSLLRFRCVSKSLRSIIGSPYFINLHMNTSAKHLKLIFVDSNKQLISTNYNSAKLKASDFGKNSLQEKLTPWERGLHICGYCNGVFLVLLNLYQLALWNPSTQKRMYIPCCPHERIISSYGFMTGLGYDSTRDDYKVVLIVQAPIRKNNSQGFQVWIFGLKSNSWRRVKAGGFFRKPVDFQSDGTFAHGDLHWSCTLDDNDSEDIVAFDVANETFSLVTQPLYPDEEKYLEMHVLDGCLCISFSSTEEAILYIGKKDGADFTWNMLYSVMKAHLPPFMKQLPPFSKYFFAGVTVLGYSKEGDKIMLDFGLGYIISYDLKAKGFQKTTITSPISRLGYAKPCFESLVPLCDESCKR